MSSEQQLELGYERSERHPDAENGESRITTAHAPQSARQCVTLRALTSQSRRQHVCPVGRP